jgi:hypothetical protein
MRHNVPVVARASRSDASALQSVPDMAYGRPGQGVTMGVASTNRVRLTETGRDTTARSKVTPAVERLLARSAEMR